MSAEFFLVVCAFLAVPVAISWLLCCDRLLPAVFVQLLFGAAIQQSGLSRWLTVHGVDLLEGQTGGSVQGIGWLGITLLVALTGAEAVSDKNQQSSWRCVLISVLGFGVALGAGTILGLGLTKGQPELVGPNGTPMLFAGAIGICLAVTALPVLIAILKDSGLLESPVGKLAVLCAVLDDLWLWLGLLIVLSIAQQHGLQTIRTLLPLCGYLLLMFCIVRPLLGRIKMELRAFRHGPVVAVSIILLSASVTEALGVHAMLGAFVGGVIMPQTALRVWGPHVLSVVRSILLPIFFVSAGLRLEIDWNDTGFWFLVVVFSFTAIVVKTAVVTLVARATGLDWPRALLLGHLMQCKGLMELVAANILHQAGIISAQTYSALSVMALISTLITLPILTRWKSITGHSSRSKLASVANWRSLPGETEPEGA